MNSAWVLMSALQLLSCTLKFIPCGMKVLGLREVPPHTRTLARNAWHTPPTQVLPMGQALPHAPQCRLLLPWSTSQPLALLPSQLPNPWKQESSTHMLLMQAVLALGSMQLGQVHEPFWHTSPWAHTLLH